MFVIRKKRIDINDLNKESKSVHVMDWIKDILITLVLVVVSLLVFYTVQA